MENHLITLMIFLPFAGALVQALLPSRDRKRGDDLGRVIALSASLASSVCGIALVATMAAAVADLQHNEVFSWVGSYTISYDMGMDGLNALLVLLVSIIFPLLIGAEWNQKSGGRGLHGLLLVVQASCLGAICSQDLFVLFFFWSLMALPFYFLIGIWGGEQRERAAFRAIVTSAIGNALFFAALVLIYYSLDPHTFSLRELSGGKLEGKTFLFLGSELSVSSVSFALLGIGLALRLPIWPLHGWFTQAAEEAPSSVFVALSAVSVPIGMYIFMRLGYSLFPQTMARSAEAILVVGAINLAIGGVCAAAQRSLLPLMAFVCVSEVGLILMGIGSLNSAGVVGAVYQEFALGLGIAGFGLFTGIIVGRTGKDRFLNPQGEADFGGVALRAPGMAIVAGLVVASLLGFPGFSGFIGHALLILGSYSVYPAAILFAGAGLLLGSFYLFTMYRHVFLGRATHGASEFEDLTFREKSYLVPLVSCLVFFGMYPKPLIDLVRPTVLTLLSVVK